MALVVAIVVWIVLGVGVSALVVWWWLGVHRKSREEQASEILLAKSTRSQAPDPDEPGTLGAGDPRTF